jgi:hypothetical protein
MMTNKDWGGEGIAIPLPQKNVGIEKRAFRRAVEYLTGDVSADITKNGPYTHLKA